MPRFFAFISFDGEDILQVEDSMRPGRGMGPDTTDLVVFPAYWHMYFDMSDVILAPKGGGIERRSLHDTIND